MKKKDKLNVERNAYERQRTTEITNAFSELQNYLPNRDVFFRSRIQILNLAIKRIKDLYSILNDDNLINIYLLENQARLKGSIKDDNSLDVANIEYIKEDSDRMYDMASYSSQYLRTRQDQADVDHFGWELSLLNWEEYLFPK